MTLERRNVITSHVFGLSHFDLMILGREDFLTR
jgi:hypothetical protein